MKLKAFSILGLLLPLACAQGSSKQAVQQSPSAKPAAEAEENSSGNERQANSTFEENDGNQFADQNQNQQAQNTDPLALISPELRAKLTPQQIAAIQQLTPQQRANLTTEQLTNLLNANGGLPGSAVGSSGSNSTNPLNAQLMTQLTGLLQQGLAGLGKPAAGGQAGQGQAGGEEEEEFEDDFGFE